jgi:hypothetical protein
VEFGFAVAAAMPALDGETQTFHATDHAATLFPLGHRTDTLARVTVDDLTETLSQPNGL